MQGLLGSMIRKRQIYCLIQKQMFCVLTIVGIGSGSSVTGFAVSFPPDTGGG